MTNKQIAALLYNTESYDYDGIRIDSWFDDETGEKNVDIIRLDTLQEYNFIANGMTLMEFKNRIEQEILAIKLPKLS